MNYLTLLRELTQRDFTERFAGSALGGLWNFIWPLVQLFIYIIIFGKFMGSRLPGTSEMYSYGVYIAAGLIPWTCFANTVIRSSRVFLDKKHIITKVRVPLGLLPLFINLSEMITFVITLFFLVVVLTLTGPRPDPGFMVLLPLIFLMQQALALALGMIAAVFTSLLRDLTEVVSIGFQLWFWFTPIVYLRDILPDFASTLVVFNPFFVFVESYHQILVFHQYIPWNRLLLTAGLTALALALAWRTLGAFERDVRDAL